MASPTQSSLAPLVARDLTKSYGDRSVLDGVDVTASPGTVLAVVGENGAGKSTLLRLLAGVEPADGGTVQRPDDVGHLGQELLLPPAATVRDVLRDALSPLHDAVARLEELAGRLDVPEVAEEYAAVLEWAVRHDAWDATRRATEAAARLGLAGIDDVRRVSTLSGGERSRLALAALLTRRPACLLLDEPTNHLDDSAAAFLEETLDDLPGVVVVASHDRVFLESVADAVLDLDAGHFGADGRGGRLHGTRGGGYSSFLEDRAAARRRWEAAYADQQDEVARLRKAAATTARRVAHNRPPRDNDKFVHHFKGANVDRTISRRVRDAERRLAVLDSDRVPRPPALLSFGHPLTGSRAGTVAVRRLEVPGRLSLDRLDVPAGERLLVTGANGAGKSTLLKVLAGRLSPADAAATTGSVSVVASRLGYLPQDVRFAEPGRTAAELFASTSPRVALADLGLLSRRQAAQAVGALSVGQQRRLALAVLVARDPDLVLLDEPTNHLSLALADELEEALQRAAGTVIVATHDRWLRRRWQGLRLELASR